MSRRTDFARGRRCPLAFQARLLRDPAGPGNARAGRGREPRPHCQSQRSPMPTEPGRRER